MSVKHFRRKSLHLGNSARFSRQCLPNFSIRYAAACRDQVATRACLPKSESNSFQQSDGIGAFSSTGIVLINEDSSWCFANQRAYDILDVSQMDAVSLARFSTVHHLDRTRVLQECDSAHILRQPFQTEFRCVRRDGTIIWVAFRSKVTFDADGQANGRLCTLEDITERKWHENLSTWQARLIELLAQSPPLKSLLTTLSRAVQQECFDVLCCVAEIKENEDFSDFCSTVHSADTEWGCKEPISHNSRLANYQVECIDLMDDANSRRFLEGGNEHCLPGCWVVPILGSNGTRFGSFSVYIENPRLPSKEEAHFLRMISTFAGRRMQEDRANIAITAGRNKVQMYLDDPSLAVVSANSKGQVLSWNKGAECMFGWRENEVLATFFPPIPWGRSEEFYKMLSHLKVTGVFKAEVQSLRRKDGTLLKVSVSARLIIENNEGLVTVMVVMADVTQRELQRARLMKLIEQQQELVQDMHDGCIQSIYAVGLNLETARKMVGSNPNDAVVEIGNAVIALNRVLSELRGFISRNDQDPSIKPALKQEIELAVALISNNGPKFGIELCSQSVHHLTVEQSMQVIQIVREAISNAARHSKASMGWVKLTLETDYIRLEIADNGIGFSYSTQGPKGLGLMHISARARRIGAKATLLSQPGQGTRIVIEIPRNSGNELSEQSEN